MHQTCGWNHSESSRQRPFTSWISSSILNITCGTSKPYPNSWGKQQNETSFSLNTLFLWTTIPAPLLGHCIKNLFQSLPFTVDVHKWLAPSQDFWVCTSHTQTHTHSFSSELGKISVDTISEIGIFAFKDINLTQGPTLGISLVLLFHSFFMAFKV